MSQESSRTGMVAGILLILLGILFMALQFIQFDFWAELWPTIIIGIGLLFFVAMLVTGRGSGGLAIPGSIITMVGLILLFNNTFGFWETWAYAWTLIVVAAGIGINIFGRYTHQEKARQSGGTVARIGLILFVLFGIFFELFIGLTGIFEGSSLLWPVLLILLGVYLLLARSGLFARRRVPEPITPSPPGEVVKPTVYTPVTPEIEPLPNEPTSEPEPESPSETQSENIPESLPESPSDESPVS
jgi:hypothetical protein